MLEIRWREGRRPAGLNNTFLWDLGAPSMPCRLVQVTLWVAAPEAKHPVNSAWFDLLTTSQTFTGKDFNTASPSFNGEQNRDFSFFTALLSLLWITLHVTRFSLTQLFCQRLSWMGGGGGGVLYSLGWISAALHLCEEDGSFTWNAPRGRIFPIFCSWEDRHSPGGVFGRRGCGEKDAVPTRFSPTVTFVVTLRVNVIMLAVFLWLAVARAMLTKHDNKQASS